MTSNRKSAMLTSAGATCPRAVKCACAVPAGPENTMRPSPESSRMCESISKMSRRGWWIESATVTPSADSRARMPTTAAALVESRPVVACALTFFHKIFFTRRGALHFVLQDVSNATKARTPEQTATEMRITITKSNDKQQTSRHVLPEKDDLSFQLQSYSGQGPSMCSAGEHVIVAVGYNRWVLEVKFLGIQVPLRQLQCFSDEQCCG